MDHAKPSRYFLNCLRLLAAAWAVLAAACSSTAPQTTVDSDGSRLTRMGPADEQQVQQMVRVGKRLTAAARKRGMQRTWTFMLSDSRVPNAGAICAPDSDAILVTAALFEVMKTDEGMAGAMAHEMGHIALNHAHARRHLMAQNLSGSPKGNRLTQKQELEADAWAFQLVKAAGYDTDRMIAAWKRYHDWQQSAGGPVRTGDASPHPSWEERIESLKRLERLQRTAAR